MSLEVRRIIDEFGHYKGVAVVEIEIVMNSQECIPAEPVARIEVIRKWLYYDEDYAMGMADGFIEGRESIQPKPLSQERAR